MKNQIISIAILVAATITFTVSCNKETDDTIKPTLTNVEIGHNDTIHAGEGIHMEFEVSDNELLHFYRITIHAEDEHKSYAHSEWEFDSTFYEIQGLKNKIVHNHAIIVPENAELGHYHFHLSVSDKAGNVTEIEKELFLSDEENEHTH
jgi:hypothetical protein